MFDKNILTFNPGWNQNGEKTGFLYGRSRTAKRAKRKGIEFDIEADESTEGPASFVIVDPDGKPILVDQHV